MSSHKTFVTKPYLPPLEEYLPYLESIWESRILTNGGPFHQQLELELSNLFKVNHVSLFSNGTIALVTALQALEISGEVITTPFSYVATANSLIWSGMKPVFVDIDRHTFNIDPQKVEAAITPRTTAILAVHCYGNPCAIGELRAICDRYQLKLIYDAAHAFGVSDLNGSILRHGDLSVVSMHATKVLNTFEGGAVISHNAKIKDKIDKLKNFGHDGEASVVYPGINGKMSEVNASMGLLQLKYFAEIIQKRQEIDCFYREMLHEIEGIEYLKIPSEIKHNYAYFPILVTEQYKLSRDDLYAHLKSNNVISRRYFYPLISDFAIYSDFPSSHPTNLPIAQEVANQVLCLPIYPGLDITEQVKIVSLIRNAK